MSTQVKHIKRAALLNPGPATDTVKYAQLVTDSYHRETDFEIIIQKICLPLTQIASTFKEANTILMDESRTDSIESVLSSVFNYSDHAVVINNGNGIYNNRNNTTLTQYFKDQWLLNHKKTLPSV